MLFFRGKRHDNKILKVKILLSRNFVVMAQASKLIKVLELNCVLSITHLHLHILSCFCN